MVLDSVGVADGVVAILDGRGVAVAVAEPNGPLKLVVGLWFGVDVGARGDTELPGLTVKLPTTVEARGAAVPGGEGLLIDEALNVDVGVGVELAATAPPGAPASWNTRPTATVPRNQ